MQDLFTVVFLSLYILLITFHYREICVICERHNCAIFFSTKKNKNLRNIVHSTNMEIQGSCTVIIPH